LSEGGRFNIGEPQLHVSLSLRKGGCLYTASTFSCAILESGHYWEKCDPYELSPLRTFALWNFQEVVEYLDHSEFAEKLKSEPDDQEWGKQRVPSISQLLGNELRKIGGDGILYPSRKDPSAHNLAFFYENDQRCQREFAVTRIRRDRSASSILC
jgi:hypothetical protein